MCVPSDENRNPIVFGADPRSFGVKTQKKGFRIFSDLNFPCKHDKSRLPVPIKFKIGVCVPHNVYRKPIVFGADPRSFWVKT